MKKWHRYLWFYLTALSLLTQAWGADVSHIQCKPIPENVSLDQVWGGTRVRFDAIETSNAIYVGYFDKDRWLSITKINICTGKINKVRLPSRFKGWDAHNSIAMELDREGRIHIAGNMHASPLIYGRMSIEDDLESLHLQPMTGIDEDKVTYPYFFLFSNGALGFAYRSGGSGNGREIINHFNETQWKRWIDHPLFASAPNSQSVSAYHTGFQLGPDGYFHIAWVWRENPSVESNFHVNYAKSKDLKNWENSSGTPLTPPLTPSNAEIVDNTGQGTGLINNIKLGFDNNGRPIISYLKFDKHGFSQLFHAHQTNFHWKLTQSTNWTYRWDPRGKGTIPGEIGFSGVSSKNGQLIESVTQPEIGNTTLIYNPQTLLTASTKKGNLLTSPLKKVIRRTPQGAILNILPVRKRGDSNFHKFSISWLSNPAGNRDKTRECLPKGPPCDFVSELQLHSNMASSIYQKNAL